jgi:hypothetical protein
LPVGKDFIVSDPRSDAWQGLLRAPEATLSDLFERDPQRVE